MPITKIPSAYRGIRRLKQIAGVFIRHGFYDMVSKTSIPGLSGGISKREQKYPREDIGKNLSTAQRLRMVFEELGPTFIKLGQMLSLEPDIIPADYVEEFKKLKDNVPPFSYEEICEIIESELGEVPEKLFKSIDSVPIAAASISQVHFGTLHSGQRVAIKIQRPNIEQSIREDIKILRRIARTLEKHLNNMELLNPVAIVAEFENFISKEMDFTNEAAANERFSSNFKDDKTIYIPNIFWDFTTPQVLVMERLDGLEMDEKEKMEQTGLDPVKIASIGLNAFAKQILDHGYFHADPHPGNSLALPDGRVALIDFGIMGFVDKELMRHLANIFIGYAEHDYDRLIAVFMSMGLINEQTDIKNFKYDLMDLSEPFYGRSLAHIQVKEIFDKALSLAAKHKMRLPRELILLFKTMVALEAMGKKLSPEANILETMKPYAMRLLGRGYDPKVIMSNMRHDLFNYANIFKNSPDLFYKLLTNVAAGKQNMNITVQLHRSEEMETSFVQSFNRVAIGMVAGTSLLAGSWILASGHKSLPISIPALGIEKIALTTLLGLIAFTMATVLGFWLTYTILFRSKQK